LPGKGSGIKIERLFVVPVQAVNKTLVAALVTLGTCTEISYRPELVIGSDLQFIRMNGTIVGALVGAAYVAGELDRFEQWGGGSQGVAPNLLVCRAR
jgi:hypothetical protein